MSFNANGFKSNLIFNTNTLSLTASNQLTIQATGSTNSKIEIENNFVTLSSQFGQTWIANGGDGQANIFIGATENNNLSKLTAVFVNGIRFESNKLMEFTSNAPLNAPLNLCRKKN